MRHFASLVAACIAIDACIAIEAPRRDLARAPHATALHNAARARGGAGAGLETQPADSRRVARGGVSSVIDLPRRFPILDWLPLLTRRDCVADAVAGLTVAAMLIPQAMSYASIAGLSPIVGLYCYVPLVVYACMGTSRYIAVGPVAIVSTTMLGVVGGEPTEAARLALASCVMFWSGVLTTVLGALDLGGFIEALDHDVLSAFVTCCAVNIGCSQAGAALRVSAARSHVPAVGLWNAARAAPGFHGPTLAVSLATAAFLALCRRLPLDAVLPAAAPKNLVGSLGPFFAMVLGAFANARWDLAGMGLREVGRVPAGLPTVSNPLFHPKLPSKLKDVAVVTLVMLTETLSMGKALAARDGRSIDNSQEAVALGAANVLGAFFRTYTIAGSFSRSAVNVMTGATSQLSALVTAGSVVATLLFFTSSFERVPKAVLAAILITAVSGLVDSERLAALRRDGDVAGLCLWLSYFASMMALGAAEGLLLSVAIHYGARTVLGF